MARRHVTPLEVGVAILALLALVLLLFPSRSGHREVANRTACAANLHGIYQSMYVYSNNNRGLFPVAGQSDPDASATGFQDKRNGMKPEHLDNNVSASLWLMVLDGSSHVQQFICPSSGEDADPLTDFDGNGVYIPDTFDFLEPWNLSYSSLNMYGSRQSRQWHADVSPERIIMGDNNNATGQGPDMLHVTTQSSIAWVDHIAWNENSQNHSDGEGQNLLFGDGHAEFATDPFQGHRGDNAMAVDRQTEINGPEIAAMPFLDNAQSPWPNFRRDSMLLPITGALGGETTLDPND